MEFIDYYTDLSGSDTDDIGKDDNNEVSLSLRKFIDDDNDIENNPLDYYDLTNVTRSVSNAEGDAFLQLDLK